MLTDETKQRIDACAAASTRARSVLVVMIVASVLVFSGWWNGRGDSWLAAYYSIADNLLRTSAGQAARDSEVAERAAKLQAMAGWDEETLRAIKKEYYEAWFSNGILIKIPFFGVAFHSADLGLLGGFTFVVILLWLIFSLGGEKANLEATFRHARESQNLAAVYEILAMRQVLTIPPGTGETRSRLWGKLPKILFLLPLAIQGLVVYGDLRTADIGRLISPSSASTVLSVGIGSLVLLAVLTLNALVVSEQVDGHWKRAAEELRPAS